MTLHFPHRTALLVSAVVVGVAACGSSGGAQGTASSAGASSAASSAQATPPVTPKPTNTSATSGGLTLTVVSATSRAAIHYEGGNQNSTTPDGQPKTVTATPGTTYVYIKTTGVNGTADAINLSCGFPVDTRLVDSRGSKYRSVEALYLLAGNPRCEQSVNPGVPFEMTWAYQVPTSATVDEFKFAAISASSLQASPPASIPVTVTPAR